MAGLLVKLIEHSRHNGYGMKLLDAIAIEKEAIDNKQADVPLESSYINIDPLSTRELEVLKLIVNGLSNKEIASELYIAPSTVKTHLKHIYSKLNVRTRSQAMVQAKKLDLF